MSRYLCAPLVTIALLLLASCGTPFGPGELSNDATLNRITLSHGSLTPGFDPSITEYSVTLAPDTFAIEVAAQPECAEALVVLGTGTIQLQPGSNFAHILVRAGDGTQQSYWLHLYRP